MAAPLFDLPNAEYFSYKNIYTGSVGDFRFRIVPEDGLLKTVTYDTYCFEVAEKLASHEAPLSDEGVQDTLNWLEEQQREFSITH